MKKRKEKIVHIGIHKHINIYINISINYCTLGIFDCLFFFGHLGIILLTEFIRDEYKLVKLVNN